MPLSNPIKLFIRKLLWLAMLFLTVHLLLVFAIPPDHNHYLCEYNHKISLLQQVPQPRVVLMGGSNTAFGINSRRLADSLHCHVVNFGLHAGIGMRYPMEDALQYLRRGDVVVLQIEYSHFFEEACNAETMPKQMAATGWRHAWQLTANEWQAVLAGASGLALGNLKRLLLYPLRHSMDSPPSTDHFTYVASGFNEYGDEVSHLSFPSSEYHPNGYREERSVRPSFCEWLQHIVTAYREKGVHVLMMPPACTSSYFATHYNEQVAETLRAKQIPYIVSPTEMVVPDSCYFDSGYHFNRHGVELNTTRLSWHFSQIHLKKGTK